MYELFRDAVTKYQKLGGLNTRNVLSYISGGWKSEIKVLEGLVSSEGCEEQSILCLSPKRFSSNLAFFGL